MSSHARVSERAPIRHREGARAELLVSYRPLGCEQVLLYSVTADVVKREMLLALENIRFHFGRVIGGN